MDNRRQNLASSAEKTLNLSGKVPHDLLLSASKRKCIHLRRELVKKYLQSFIEKKHHSFKKISGFEHKGDTDAKAFILNKSFRFEHLEEELMKASRTLTDVICFSCKAEKLVEEIKQQPVSKKGKRHWNITLVEELIDEAKGSKKKKDEELWQIHLPAKPDRDFNIASIHPFSRS